MNSNKENLEGLVSKLKQSGINAGKKEQQRIIESARQEAAEIISNAEKQSKEIIAEADKKASQLETNAQTSIAQASRDMIEATKTAVLHYLKAVFKSQSESLFTQHEYASELLKAVLEVIPGDKTATVPDGVLKKMEAFLIKQALAERVVLKPLGETGVQIIVESDNSGDVQFVLNPQDIEDGLFSLLNKELVERIIKGQEQ